MMISPGRRPSGRPNWTASPAATSTSPAAMSARPILNAPANCDLRTSNYKLRTPLQFHAPEEISQLEGRRLRRVGSVRGIELDRRAELLAERAGVGLARIGRAHQRAPLLD